MKKLLNALKRLFKPQPKRQLTPQEKQALDEQVIIIDPITRDK